MSEQALKAAASGTVSATATATTGSFPVMFGGKAEPAAGKELPKVAIEKPDIEQLAKELNTVSRNIGRDLRFQVDLDKGRAVLQVIDRETGKLIRQIPQEKAAVAIGENGSVGIRLFDDLV